MSDVKARQPNLAQVLLTDWLSHIWVVILVIAVLMSAYAVIYYAWGNRQLNAEVQQLLEDKDKLDIDWRHMLLEHNALSEHSRIEQIAREKLDMVRPQGQQEKVIKQP
ncbi:cell division protein FtsL [Catenovulum agarivorans DS-2]|uniref:Cell division protein FtsL n=1 Tax=Catenovulum agarivorans DS-2 TaxID=1328313 RepID=W7QE71_9ALTE|nr:cell division protein FtsL [Catenovulum agarivorans]EWH11194.1 cell division protein FtsL [Catenovulum agarivorans DS-2]